jgi:hypothetical protein
MMTWTWHSWTFLASHPTATPSLALGIKRNTYRDVLVGFLKVLTRLLNNNERDLFEEV